MAEFFDIDNETLRRPAVKPATMVNEQHTPSKYEERVLQILKEGRKSEQPWGYTTPSRVAERFDDPRQRVNEALNQLEAAGWVQQVEEDNTPIRGLYVFVADPRENEM